ncbi:hypothetical protein ACFLWZ_00620 [Chloroflexota bacterium]
MVKINHRVKPVKVKADIQPRPVSPAMRRAWATWWRLLITSVKSEVSR